MNTGKKQKPYGITIQFQSFIIKDMIFQIYQELLYPIPKVNPRINTILANEIKYDNYINN